MKYCSMNVKYMVNGDGLRVVLRISDLENYVDDFLFDEKVREELFALLKNDLCNGLTLIGGEPFSLSNSKYIAKLFLEIKEKFPNKTIWCYTKYKWKELIDYRELDNNYFDIIESVDVLLDGNFNLFQPFLTSSYVGGGKHCVIDVKKSLDKKQEMFYIFDYNHTLGIF